jgi:hypothetical protein
MRFTDPPDEAIVIDGKYSWFYTPSTAPHQVIRMAAESDPVYGQNLLARVLDRPSDRYEATWLRRIRWGAAGLGGIDRSAGHQSEFFARGAVAGPRGRVAAAHRARRGSGTRRILTLSKIRTNANIAPDVFEFRVPRGVRIVDQ